MKKIFILFLLTISLSAQDLDSLYLKLMNMSQHFKHTNSITDIEGRLSEKCGFGIRATIKEKFEQFNMEQQNSITEVLERPDLSESIISPSGIFKIHYNNSGVHQPAYDINDLAAAFDSAYNFEVNVLGYPSPPSDGSLGGDDKYDIYVKNLSGGLYGATTPENTIGEGKYVSYIEIDNSFGKNEGYNSFGISGARATAAHEFHHAIQLGNYIFRSEDTYYYEITSTAFEEFVFDEVNDYYAYIPSYFKNTGNKLENNSGYDLAIWNIFLQERFDSEDPLLGHNIVKRSWEHMLNSRAAVSIAKALNDYNQSFNQLFNEFGDWIYFTNTRSKENMFFEESQNYPLVKSTYELNLENEKTLNLQSNPTSINFLTFFDFSQGFADTVVAVLSNSDVYGASNNGYSNIQFTISNELLDNAYSINDIFYAKIEGERTDFIQSSYIINNELSDVPITRNEIDFAYPQPFNYQINNVVSIPTFPDPSGKAELKIFSSDMNLVYSGEEAVLSNENIVVRWNGLDENGEKLASGVYVYVTKANGKIKKGKFVILN